MDGGATGASTKKAELKLSRAGGEPGLKPYLGWEACEQGRETFSLGQACFLYNS